VSIPTFTSVIFNSPICQTSYTSESFITASDLGPGAEFEDEERQHLIDKLNSLLAGPGENYTLPPSMWATLWLCDLGRLKDLVKGLESTLSFRARLTILLQLVKVFLTVVCFCLLPSGLVLELTYALGNQQSRDSGAQSGASTPRPESTPPSSPVRGPLTPHHQRSNSLQSDSTSTSLRSSHNTNELFHYSMELFSNLVGPQSRCSH
jgi:hypothetical protein